MRGTAYAVIVLTDLDGTLLDHETYSWSLAKSALRHLHDNKIPLVFVTSKTAAEVTDLRNATGNIHPFIVENGAAIIIPEGYFGHSSQTIILGCPHATLLAFLHECRSEGYRFISFHDMDTDGIMAHTGLDEKAARFANERAATEPLLWQDSEEAKNRFIKKAGTRGFQALQGGRFLSLGGKTDKGNAAFILLEHYHAAGHRFETIIALGDSDNDVALLQKATHPVWIRKTHPSPATPFMTNARSTIEYGPKGWNSAVLSLLTPLDG